MRLAFFAPAGCEVVVEVEEEVEGVAVVVDGIVVSVVALASPPPAAALFAASVATDVEAVDWEAPMTRKDEKYEPARRASSIERDAWPMKKRK